MAVPDRPTVRCSSCSSVVSNIHYVILDLKEVMYNKQFAYLTRKIWMIRTYSFWWRSQRLRRRPLLEIDILRSALRDVS